MNTKVLSLYLKPVWTKYGANIKTANKRPGWITIYYNFKEEEEQHRRNNNIRFVSRNGSDGYSDYVSGSNSDSTSSGTTQTIGIDYIIDNANLDTNNFSNG